MERDINKVPNYIMKIGRPGLKLHGFKLGFVGWQPNKDVC